jgi:PiT family inorganic phosphate transporter
MKVIVRSQRPLKVDRWFRRLQLFSAALFSLGHGTNDSQKGMGMITAALVSSGLLHTTAGGKLPSPSSSSSAVTCVTWRWVAEPWRAAGASS